MQTVAGLSLLGGGLYAALKHPNKYWGYAIGALSTGGLLVANALFNTLSGLNQATRDFARKNFNSQYFDISQATPISTDIPTNGAEKSLASVQNFVNKVWRNMSVIPYR